MQGYAVQGANRAVAKEHERNRTYLKKSVEVFRGHYVHILCIHVAATTHHDSRCGNCQLAKNNLQRCKRRVGLVVPGLTYSDGPGIGPCPRRHDAACLQAGRTWAGLQFMDKMQEGVQGSIEHVAAHARVDQLLTSIQFQMRLRKKLVQVGARAGDLRHRHWPANQQVRMQGTIGHGLRSVELPVRLNHFEAWRQPVHACEEFFQRGVHRRRSAHAERHFRFKTRLADAGQIERSLTLATCQGRIPHSSQMGAKTA
jgi:hypothetical protein